MESTFWRRAIVLKKTLQGGLRHHLLDEYTGRIIGIWKTEFPAGTILKYSVKRFYSHNLFTDQCVIDDMPLFLAKTDLIFLHHLLEICYYFIPIGSGSQGIFNLIAFIYNQPLASKTLFYKKFLVFKLLHLIGLCPELSIGDTREIAKFIACSVDTGDDQFIDLSSELVLDRWLLACIMQHPHYEQLNTINFLLNHRLL